MSDAHAAAALGDVVVLDWTTELWSGLASALLADFGADVIHIESPGRALAADRARGEEGDALASLHGLCNRNKRSLALDLDGEPGREILRELIKGCDVFATDLPMARQEALGWDYAALSARKPDLVFARATGFGPEGPDRDAPALDELAAARTGMMPILPQPGQPPVYPGSGSMYSAVMLAFGVMLALNHRAATGEGQVVDASLLAGNMYGASLDLQAYLAMGGERFLHPVSRLDAGNPMSGTLYASKDGRWVTLTMPDTGRWWPDLSAAVGLAQDDPRFDTHDKRCGDNRLELIAVLEEAFARDTGGHWRRVFDERQMSADVIEDYAYPAADAQARRNRYVLEGDRPGVGAIKGLGFPIFLSDAPARLRRTAPASGQHGAEILFERLGYSEDRVAELEDAGVLG